MIGAKVEWEMGTYDHICLLADSCSVKASNVVVLNARLRSCNTCATVCIPGLSIRLCAGKVGRISLTAIGLSGQSGGISDSLALLVLRISSSPSHSDTMT